MSVATISTKQLFPGGAHNVKQLLRSLVLDCTSILAHFCRLFLATISSFTASLLSFHSFIPSPFIFWPSLPRWTFYYSFLLTHSFSALCFSHFPVSTVNNLMTQHVPIQGLLISMAFRQCGFCTSRLCRPKMWTVKNREKYSYCML